MDRNIPVVLPQWLDNCLRYHYQLPYDPYRLPTPSIYYQNKPDPATIYPYPTNTNALSHLPDEEHSTKNLFYNQVVYFGNDVRLDQVKIHLIPLMHLHIQSRGGIVVTEYNPHRVTIVVLKYRSSLEYKQAVRDKKCIAIFWWLTNTFCRGYMCSPLDCLLDYPVPKVGIPNMSNCVIALTGFKGPYRSFINILIVACGARYSPELENDTTHLICGGGYGDKYAKLSNYPNVKLVNHLWLEECYAQWRKIDCQSDRRYSYIPKNNALLVDTIAKTHLIPHVIDTWKNNTYDREPQVVYEEYDVGFVEERKPRKAAVRAKFVLNEHIMPDANAYEREYKNKK